MVTFIHKLVDCDFSALSAVYVQSLEHDRRRYYTSLDTHEGSLLAEQSFYQFLAQIFFKTQDAVLAVYSAENGYTSALRLEPYKDGFLLSGLETAPEHRRKGFGLSLVREALSYCADHGVKKVYAHIHKQNRASEKLHLSAGFRFVQDGASLLDGTYTSQFATFCYNTDGCQ